MTLPSQEAVKKSRAARVAGATRPAARRADEAMLGHRGGGATKRMASSRPQPSGMVEVAGESARRSSSTMSSHRLLLAPPSRTASSTSAGHFGFLHSLY